MCGNECVHKATNQYLNHSVMYWHSSSIIKTVKHDRKSIANFFKQLSNVYDGIYQQECCHFLYTGIGLFRIPMLSKAPLDLFKAYFAVQNLGGFINVSY